MRKHQEKEQGSITIEATIALSAFMFMIVTLLTIVNICIAQAKINYAINATARQISQYTYLYSITGLNEVHKDVYNAGKKNTEDLNTVIDDTSAFYNKFTGAMDSAGNLVEHGKEVDSIDDLQAIKDEASGLVDKGKDLVGAGKKTVTDIATMAKNPKKLIFGLAQMAASEGFDKIKSWIGEGLAKGLCEKNLLDGKDGDVESYLKHLRIVPVGDSYYDGLDFSKTQLFPDGSYLIRVTVSYDISVVPLLPFNFSFHFCQSAYTYGWGAGEVSFPSATKVVTNDTIWNTLDPNARASQIRSAEIENLMNDKSKHYEKICGDRLTNIHLYDPENKEFVSIATSNAMYSEDGTRTRSLDDVSEIAIKEELQGLCGGMKATTERATEVTSGHYENGNFVKEKHDSTGAKNTVYLVIPEDDKLEEKYNKVIKDMQARGETQGVNITIVKKYGKGAQTSVVPDEGNDGDKDDN